MNVELYENGEIKDKMNDFEMMVFYNPYYHEQMVDDIQDDIDDLYHHSSSRTDFDNVYGIASVSSSVESLVLKITSLQKVIKRYTRTFNHHRTFYDEAVKGFNDTKLQQLDRYFQNQIEDKEGLTYPFIEVLKAHLYTAETEHQQEVDQREEVERKERLRQHAELIINTRQETSGTNNKIIIK